MALVVLNPRLKASERSAGHTATHSPHTVHLEFTNRGALITSWELTTYMTPDGDPVQIVNGHGEVGLVLETERGVIALDDLMYQVRRERGDGGGQRVVFEAATADGMRIRGGGINGGSVDSRGDHRIAMSFAMAGLRASGEILIDDCENVNTSFPGFVDLASEAGLGIAQLGM